MGGVELEEGPRRVWVGRGLGRGWGEVRGVSTLGKTSVVENAVGADDVAVQLSCLDQFGGFGTGKIRKLPENPGDLCVGGEILLDEKF